MGGGTHKEIRDSEICWIRLSNETQWIYDKLSNIALEVNRLCWEFDIHGFNESCQYAIYSEPNGHYNPHSDIDGKGHPVISRKVSIVVQLSSPSDYEGGTLVLQPGNKATPKGLGLTAIFPSYLLHEVTPVTSGTRNSLVAWISGPPFK